MSLRKVINSSTQQFEPVLVDKLVLDAVPTVNSFNSVTSDAVARAIADSSPLPEPEAEDAGKVLGVLNASGDIGWVIDQSGTFTQVQADWEETDSSKPSYIDNKPDLSVYATASSVETALAGKQDTISDLSEIRAGAAKGDTAVQPAALDDYATTSAMNTALAGKQDTISDLATIRSGAAAGATAVQPPALESYATTSAMNTALAGKQDTISDLAAIRAGAQAGSTAVQPATLESYATTSAMNTALAGKQDVINDLSDIRAGAALGATAAQPSDLPSSDELLPSSTSVDAGKVLTVGNDGTASWITPSAGTVYTSGDGIGITNDVISADVDGTTIGIDSTTKKIKSLQVIPTKTSDLQNDSNFVVASSLATVATTGNYSDLSGKPTIPSVDQTYNASSTNAQSGVAVAQAIAAIPSSSYTAGDGIDITNDTISADVDGTTIGIDSTTKQIKLLSIIPTVDQTYDASSANAQSGVAVASAISAISVDEVPAVTSSDGGKVLQATYSGGTGSYSWETAPTPANKPLAGGNCITVTENTNDVSIAFTTTAGITDIQLVNALPASPVATVLYIIPST